MERLPPESLSSIMAEVRNAEAKSKAQKRSEEQLKAQSEELFRQTSALLEHGEVNTKFINISGGSGLVGMKDEEVKYLATPPIQVEVDNERVSLRVVQDVSGGPNWSIRRDSISIKTCDDGGKEKTLFQISRSGYEGVKNWLGERATAEQIMIASEIVSFIESSLPKIPHTPERDI